jgi:hypothetical protein
VVDDEGGTDSATGTVLAVVVDVVSIVVGETVVSVVTVGGSLVDVVEGVDVVVD